MDLPPKNPFKPGERQPQHRNFLGHWTDCGHLTHLFVYKYRLVYLGRQ